MRSGLGAGNGRGWISAPSAQLSATWMRPAGMPRRMRRWRMHSPRAMMPSALRRALSNADETLAHALAEGDDAIRVTTGAVERRAHEAGEPGAGMEDFEIDGDIGIEVKESHQRKRAAGRNPPERP